MFRHKSFFYCIVRHLLFGRGQIFSATSAGVTIAVTLERVMTGLSLLLSYKIKSRSKSDRAQIHVRRPQNVSRRVWCCLLIQTDRHTIKAVRHRLADSDTRGQREAKHKDYRVRGWGGGRWEAGGECSLSS